MLNFISSSESTLLFVVKIGLWLFLLIYLVFSATIIKQIKIMTETLTTGFEKYLKTAGMVHFFFALLVLVLAFIVL